MLFVADSAKEKISELMNGESLDDSYFVRVSVTSGGCSGLSYEMDFDNESRPDDQIFDDNDVRVVTSNHFFTYVIRHLNFQVV